VKTFLTRIDLSDDRQIVQRPNTLTTFSGSLTTLQYTTLGQNYSDLPLGVDILTSGVTYYSSPITVFSFTGTTGSTTYFGIPTQYSDIIPNLPIITDQNYFGTNFISYFFNPTETVVVDGNSFDISFSGVEFNFNVYDFAYLDAPLTGTTFSGYCSTSWINTLSARTYDWWYITSGNTTWLDVLGRTNTEKLSVQSVGVPTLSGDTGITGTITWDNNYLYVCVGTNTWKRCPLSDW